MNSLSLKLTVLLLVLGSTACSLGPVEEDEDPSAPSGPGVFTGDKGEFSVNDLFDEEKKRLGGGGYYILDLEGAPPMSQQEFKEFESFRAWLKSREEGTDEYKEYESWKAFQQYRSYQSQQPGSAK